METSFSATLHLLRSESLTSVAYKAIEQMILNGELLGGERVNENVVAAKLAISRGPVREALRALEQSGLVRVVANRGVFIREFSLEEALQAYDIRACLFGLAGDALAQLCTPKQIAVLVDLVEQMEAVKANNDISSYYSLNLQFHSALVEFSGNGELTAIYRRLVNKLHLFRRQSLLLGGGLNVSNYEHRRILRALIAHDPKRARRLMEEHILAGKQRFLKALGEMPDQSLRRKAANED